jgi:AraC-like DNA-binding protein
MSSLPAAAARTLSVFAPPYEELVPCGPEIVDELVDVDAWKGCALVWQLTGADQTAEFAALHRKAPGLPLLVLLPPPLEVHAVLRVLPLVRTLGPRLVLPHGIVDTPYRLRSALALAPRGVAQAVTHYLAERGVLNGPRETREFRRIMELAPDVPSISALSRRMYTSRRTLGRHFSACRLPVPSHCLQIARILYVSLQLHNDDAAVFRIAARFGYPDGFTLSNQMKRMIGYRPSEVRELLGWEWIVEAWLKREGLS